jgi:hypothetical protein
VREAQEVEGSWSALSRNNRVLGSEPPEAQQAGFVSIQLQAETRQAVFELDTKTYGVRAMLKAEHHVVGVAHDENIAASMAPAPLLDPQIEDVVQENVGQQGRSRRALRAADSSHRLLTLVKDARAEPLLDESDNPRIRNPVLNKTNQPPVVNGVEEPTNVCIEHPVHLLPLESDGKRIQRIMLTSLGPKPVGEADEVDLVDRVQHIDDRTLDDLVLQRCDAEGSLTTVRLRNEDATTWFCSVRSPHKTPV